MKKNHKDQLLFLPLGGAGEIGMNCYLYHYKESWIMVDLGVTFSDSNDLSYEIIMPDLNFILEQKSKLSAIILTHAHEDHIGAVPYLYNKFSNTPIYTTSFTASVLRRKFDSVKNIKPIIKLLEYNKKFKIGNFDIEILKLTHSIPEPNAIIISTDKGNIFHTGDWKIDPSPLVGEPINQKKLSQVKKTGIDVMICDSTNVFNENPSGSEFEVRKKFKEVFKNFSSGKIIVTCFASNIARLETILQISSEFQRSCVLLGRSIKRIYESALENGYLENQKNIISEKDAKNFPDDNLVLICTGSQGEARASLSRVINNKHNFFILNKNDMVIFSSREIPGNEKQINQLKTQINKIGCKILDHRTANIHVSGHPSKKELLQMYKWIAPKFVIPIHGEYRHLLEHKNFIDESKLSKSLLVENGDLVSFEKKSKVKIIDKIFSGRNVIRGSSIYSIENNLFSKLNYINSNGELFIVLVLNLENEFKSDPIIFCPTITESEDDLELLKEHIETEFKSFANKNYDDQIIAEQLRIISRSFIKQKYGLKPLTCVEIVRI